MPFCTIIPEHVLSKIINANQAPEHVLTACQSTLDRTRQYRNTRHHHCQQAQAALQQQQPHETAHPSAHGGIVPSYVHSSIVQNTPHEGSRESAIATIKHETESVAEAAKAKTLKRTIYDAQHSWNENNPPRNKVLIKEGGPLISDKADPSNDPNEAYIGFKKTYDFYKTFFKRNSVDGKGLPLDGFVHFGVKYQNAFWDGKQMVFGDGDGVYFNGFTDELDVIAHELTHGVTQYTTNLTYEGQSGALNESLSDVFGIMVKQYGEKDTPQTAEQSSWLIGEGIWGKTVKGVALRSMKAPGTAYDDPTVGKDEQPAHWKDLYRGTEDSGGVHINSGIPNHAFYLACVAAGGYAWETIGPVWYKTITSGKVGTEATFKEFADVTIANAGKYEAQVKKAWTDVGYPFPENSEL